MKKFLSLLLLLSLYTGLCAQSNLLVTKEGGQLVLEHKVQAKENFYSVGRLYNIHPRHLAAYNRLSMEKGLNLGQALKIPLTDTNFRQTGMEGVPLFYLPGGNESLNDIGRKFGAVTTEQLRHWNALTASQDRSSKKLVIGFLVTSEMSDQVVRLGNEPVKEEKVKEPTTVENKVNNVVKKQEDKPVDPGVKPEPKLVNAPAGRSLPAGAGYFKPHFESQVKRSPASKEELVTSGIFKTTSGWEDGRFYMLMDGVETGSFVRIINPANNKAIYAKVLYGMEGIRQNQGLDIRISNAAAAALEIQDTEKFIVKVNY